MIIVLENAMSVDAYLFGMILQTTSLLLEGAYPAPDTYAEIAKKYVLPGGETGAAAIVLDSLGVKTKIDGNHIGGNSAQALRAFYAKTNIDTSALTVIEDYPGLEDFVIVDSATRTPFGMFARLYADTVTRWNMPSENDVKKARVVAIDPWFREATDEAVRLCLQYETPYVTIDCAYESVVARHANVIALSREALSSLYPNERDIDALHLRYLEASPALVIITHGANDIAYGRRGNGVSHFAPYAVDVVSTLGAGDTFKAGCVYAALNGYDDRETVRFASACAAVACARFPLPLHPPTLTETISLMNTKA